LLKDPKENINNAVRDEGLIYLKEAEYARKMWMRWSHWLDGGGKHLDLPEMQWKGNKKEHEWPENSLSENVGGGAFTFIAFCGYTDSPRVAWQRWEGNQKD
jgi:hypothetical protein